MRRDNDYRIPILEKKLSDIYKRRIPTIRERNWERRLKMLDAYDMDYDTGYWISQYAQMMECADSIIYLAMPNESRKRKYTKSEFKANIKKYLQAVGIDSTDIVKTYGDR